MERWIYKSKYYQCRTLRKSKHIDIQVDSVWRWGGSIVIRVDNGKNVNRIIGEKF
jgi:hypothetical protein